MMNKIPLEEYRQRAERLQAAMEAERLDALLVFSWKRGQVRYVSGYHPNYVANLAVVVLPRQGAPALRIRFPFDMERARRESWIDDIAASGNPAQLLRDAASLLRERGLAQARLGLATGDNVINEMPYTLHAILRGELPEATLLDAGRLLLRERQIKSPAEFDLLRLAARLADAGAEASRRALTPGRSEFEVVAAAEAAMRSLGAEMHLVVISSKGGTELVGPPEEKLIEAGDNLILEIAVQKSGYTAQTARVFFAGDPTSDQRQIYRAVYRAYQAGLAAAQPGHTCADVAAAMQGELERSGLGDHVEQDFGHGIGIDLPEPPRIELEDHTLLEPGMVLVIHPSVRLPSVGSAFLGGTVLVSASGPEPIHAIPEDPYPGGARP
jgi:Xaa-Pro aminopeptidase